MLQSTDHKNVHAVFSYRCLATPNTSADCLSLFFHLYISISLVIIIDGDEEAKRRKFKRNAEIASFAHMCVCVLDLAQAKLINNTIKLKINNHHKSVCTKKRRKKIMSTWTNPIERASICDRWPVPKQRREWKNERHEPSKIVKLKSFICWFRHFFPFYQVWRLS